MHETGKLTNLDPDVLFHQTQSNGYTSVRWRSRSFIVII